MGRKNECWGGMCLREGCDGEGRTNGREGRHGELGVKEGVGGEGRDRR